MMEKVYLVWKIPKESWGGGDEFAKRGIYPSGELMGIRSTRPKAEKMADSIDDKSPSERFEEQPYMFHVSCWEVA